MGRPAKVTKHSLLIAIDRCLTVTAVAQYLEVDRHTVYDAAKRFGIDLSTAFKRFSTQEEACKPVLAPPVTSVQTQPPAPVQTVQREDKLAPYRDGYSLNEYRRWRVPHY